MATSGSRNKPYTVPVKAAESPGPRRLSPARTPPSSAASWPAPSARRTSPGATARRASGEDCDKDAQCTSRRVRRRQVRRQEGRRRRLREGRRVRERHVLGLKCAAAKKASGEDCEANDECDSGSCKEGQVLGRRGGGKFPRVWMGISLSLDFYVDAGRAERVLADDGSDQQRGLRLPRSAGNSLPPDRDNQRLHRPEQERPGGGRLRPRAPSHHGELRLRAEPEHDAGRARGIRGARPFPPSAAAFPPVHLEARFTYLFGKDALLASRTDRPRGGGWGVRRVRPGERLPRSVTELANPKNSNPVNAWLAAGPIFAAAGGGARFMLREGSRRPGPQAPEAFGGTASFLFGFVPEAGLQVGF